VNYQKQIIMGIKHLNRYLMENCSSSNAIQKIHLSDLANKTVLIDTSIYLYKFIEKNTLLENIYLMISIFKHYSIIPVFVFDGKPPTEKKELLDKRRADKKVAEDKYNVLKHELEVASSGETPADAERKEDLIAEMESLKKKFVRIRESDTRQAKELMEAFGVSYLESYGEADQLCAYLMRHNYAWACVSDDMDMFVYGCQRVLRHMSLLQHTAILYNSFAILNDLNISQSHFCEILILSGTDYNIHEKTSLIETFKWFKQFEKYCSHKETYIPFYDWLMEHSKYIRDRTKLDKVASMFDLGLFALNNHDEIREIIRILPFRNKNMDIEKVQKMMEEDGFLFV
jgi:5'-3' exonuclease